MTCPGFPTMVEATRRDGVIVLAGGDSRRMGQPKGLCLEGDDPRPLLRRVFDIYEGWNWPVVVALTAALKPVYHELLPADRVRWAERPEGGGTAATVAVGFEVLKTEVTHLWLHPIDLPFVRQETIEELRECSMADSGMILIPKRPVGPGHPVVFPVSGWPDDVTPMDSRSMSDVIATCGVSQRLIDVRDEGVVRDLDRPEDLSKKEDS